VWQVHYLNMHRNHQSLTILEGLSTDHISTGFPNRWANYTAYYAESHKEIANPHKVPSDSVHNAIHHSRSIDSTWALNGLFRNTYLPHRRSLLRRSEGDPFHHLFVTPIIWSILEILFDHVLVVCTIGENSSTMIHVSIPQRVNSSPYVRAKESIAAFAAK
jgi:hypothetical protein